MTKPPLSERKRLGRNLRNARLNHGWTQLQLCAELGVWLQTVQRWERGESYPIPRRLVQLSQVLDISIQQLREEEHGGDDPGED